MLNLRTCSIAATLAAACFVTVGAVPQQTVSPAAAHLIDAARTAIGITPKTPGPRSLRLTGTYYTSQIVSTDRDGTRRVTESEEPNEIRILFPDAYVEIGQFGPFESWRGFNGDIGIRRTIGLSPDAQVSSRPSFPEAAAASRRDLTRLVLGMLAQTITLPDLAIGDAGPNAISLTDAGMSGPQALIATLEFDPATRLPARLVRKLRARILTPGAVLGSGGGGIGPGPVGSDAPEETFVTTFADRREVAGYKLPFRVTTSVRGITLAEHRFVSIDVNPSLTRKDFE